MDNTTLEKIQDYIDKIPQEVQDLIFDPIIDTRISEISQKYNLNSVQNQTLSDLVIITLAGAGNPDNLLSNITEDVGISSFVAQQIIEDIDSRIVGYIELEMDKKNNYQKEVLPVPIKQKIPDISIPRYIPKPKVVVENEPIQAPVSVPRFKAVPLEEGEIGQNFIPNIASKPNAGGIMESKINSVLDNSQPQKQSPEIKKYSTDPYREPLS